ncbi:MAG: TonB-dependent receptor, partial [Candidatus Didemnitutus sp.]|nr:TonB-dependent receptor [Candidatus Didemnitutus sp.]
NIDGTPLPNETGLGSEAGVKINFLEDKLSMSVTAFDIERENIARETTFTDPLTFLTERVVILSGREQARGVEMDFNWQATESLQFLGGYGNVVAKTLENKEFPFLSNTTPRRVPRHNVGLASRYEFKYGTLKGLYATLGMKYYSESLVNAGSGRILQPSLATAGTPLRTLNVINGRHGNGALLFPDQPENAIVVLRSVWNPATLSASRESIRVGDGREQIMNAGYSAWEASVGYRWRDRPRKLSHKVQVNVKNLFDTRYTWGSGVAADPFTVIGTYSLTF